MSTTLIEKLFAAGSAITGRAYRAMAFNRDGVIEPVRGDCYGSQFVTFCPRSGRNDVFNRFRISKAFKLFEGSQTVDNAPLVFVESLSGGGTATYRTNEASTRLVAGSNGATAIRQSREYLPYEPGRSQQVFVTGVFSTGVTDIPQRMGFFDANNGVYLEQDGSTVNLVLRSYVTGSVVETRIPQSSWNIDKLDGTGTSGLTLDVTKFTILEINFGWLGGAGVLVSFIIGGQRVLAHSFDLTANVTVYWSNPALPVRWEVSSTTTGSAYVDQICAAVFSEGGYTPEALPGAPPDLVSKSINTTFVPLMSVRLNPSYPRRRIRNLIHTIYTETNDAIIVKIILRSTLTGASWTNSSTGYSQYDSAATAVSGGYVSFIEGVDRNGTRQVTRQTANSLPIVSDFSGTPDIATLAVRSVAGAATVYGALNWEEVL